MKEENMSFFEKAAKVAVKGAQGIVHEAQQKRKRIDRHKMRLEKCSDEQLRKRFKSSTDGEVKIAIHEIMTERGY